MRRRELSLRFSSDCRVNSTRRERPVDVSKAGHGIFSGRCKETAERGNLRKGDFREWVTRGQCKRGREYEKGLAYYDYVAVLKHGRKTLAVEASNPTWKDLVGKLSKIQPEQAFNSSCEVVR